MQQRAVPTAAGSIGLLRAPGRERERTATASWVAARAMKVKVCQGRSVACAHMPMPIVTATMTAPIRAMRCHSPAPRMVSAGGRGSRRWRG